MEPIRFGSVGLGNYAKQICQSLINTGHKCNPPVKLIAVCEPSEERYQPMAQTLAQAGIPRFEKYEQLLEQNIEALWLPLPIPLHRSFTEQALAAGKAVIVEKPVAPTLQDVDALIAARDRAKKLVSVGFHSLSNPSVNQIKRMLLAGDLGAIKLITIRVAGPRGDTYYSRSAWAGKVAMDGQWVLDSPANNAFAHGLHTAMYLAGSALSNSATPLSIDAELYRINPIESYDTCSFRINLAGNIPLLVLMTHACEFNIDQVIEIQCEQGNIQFVRDIAVVQKKSGTEILRPQTEERMQFVERFAKEFRGQQDDRALPTLETARNQVLLVNGAMETTAIHNIPEQFTRKIKTTQGIFTAVIGIEAMMTLSARMGCMFHESGLFPWTKPARHMDLSAYHHFPNQPANPLLASYLQAAPQTV